MAGGEYVSVSTQKDTEEAAVVRERDLLMKIQTLLGSRSMQLISRMASVRLLPSF